MKISKIEIGYIDIPLITPFKTALRTVSSVNDLLVKVTAEDGTFGIGEAPPTAVITGDTKESIERRADMAFENITAWEAGAPVRLMKIG